MPDLNVLDEPLIDEGFPSDAALDLIQSWTGTPRALVEDLLTPIFSEYGSIAVVTDTDDLDVPIIRVRLGTDGWVASEATVGALMEGMFWFAWWESSQREGTFTFKVPASLWETPMPTRQHFEDGTAR